MVGLCSSFEVIISLSSVVGFPAAKQLEHRCCSSRQVVENIWYEAKAVNV